MDSQSIKGLCCAPNNFYFILVKFQNNEQVVF